METLFWLLIVIVVGGGILGGVLQAVILSKAEKKNKASSIQVQAIPTVQSQGKVIITKVVGVTKLNDRGIQIQSLLPTLSQDSDALLVREKENQYDSNAIKVIADYQHIGYVKADLASQIAPMIDSGKSSRCAILCITGGGDKSYGCNIRIDIEP